MGYRRRPGARGERILKIWGADRRRYLSRAAPGTGYVEFDVPSERLQVLGDGNVRIIGPGAGDIYNTLRAQRGLEPFTELSPASNISDWLAMRW